MRKATDYTDSCESWYKNSDDIDREPVGHSIIKNICEAQEKFNKRICVTVEWNFFGDYIVLTETHNKTRNICELRSAKNDEPRSHQHIHTHHRQNRISEKLAEEIGRGNNDAESDYEWRIFFHKDKENHPDESGWRNRTTYHILCKNNSHTHMRQ